MTDENKQSGKELNKMLTHTYYCGKQVKIKDAVKSLQAIVRVLANEANNSPFGVNGTVPVGLPLGQLVMRLSEVPEHSNTVDMTDADDSVKEEEMEEETPRTGVARALANMKRPGEGHETPEFLKKPRFN